MKESSGFLDALRRLQQLTAVRAVRGGLMNLFPVLIIGAFALILKTFPVAAYQTAIATFAGGFFVDLFDLVNSATFGVLSVHMTYSISRSYMKLKADPEAVSGGAVFASLTTFFILSGVNLSDFGTDSMGPKSMFLAIISGLGASALYLVLSRALRNLRHKLFSSGADREFNRMLSSIAPIILVGVCFGVVNMLVVRAFGVDSFRTLLSYAFNDLFARIGNGFFKGFFFVLFSSVLWFFGIHGSDTLENVMQTYFTPISAGAVPGASILTKEFFDCFVLMGGCGTAICLLIAILIFSRNRARRGLGYTAAFPMLFNINELMVFGLPIIFNPTMLIPFLLAPLVCYTTAYFALSAGLVPYITQSVEWTTPVLLGGYWATGSVAGSILQMVNIVLGVLIYLPFLRLLDKQSAEASRRNYQAFTDFFRKNEQEIAGMRLTERADVFGDFAKDLCADLRHGMGRQVVLAYQPQYAYSGACIGVEALLRWNHPVYGMLYPPLIFKLASEGGFLPALEEAVLLKALSDIDAVKKRFGDGVKISVNVTGATVTTPRFLQFCKAQSARVPFRENHICIEVTEQTGLGFDDATEEALRSLREMGALLAIDDFSMGQTSIHYLKDSFFDIIKLDGTLVKGMFTHENGREIISSIVSLADSLNLLVLAEYVETEEQREALHEMGCDTYQGYLYSPAVFLDEPEK